MGVEAFQGDRMEGSNLLRSFRPIIAVMIALAAGLWVISRINFSQVVERLNRIPELTLAVGFLCYCLFVGTKACRFRAILGVDRSILALMPIFSIHTFFSNVLPFRSADLSYLYLLNKRESVSGSVGLASLIIASVIDLVLMLALLAVAGLYSGMAGLSYALLFYLPTLTLLTLILSLFVFSQLAGDSPRSLRLFGQLESRLTHLSSTQYLIGTTGERPKIEDQNQISTLWHRLLIKVVSIFMDLWQALTAPELRQRQGKIWILSALSLAVRFGFQIYLIQKMESQLSVVSVLFALSFTNLFNLLPIQSIGNLGTIEAPFTWALTKCGVSLEVSLATGLSLHLVILCYASLIGLFGFLNHNRPK